LRLERLFSLPASAELSKTFKENLVKRLNSNLQTLPFVVALLIFKGGILCPGAVTAASTVQLSPGANIQAAVAANPAGTHFILLAGIYRQQSVQPKNYDTFTGEGTVVLNGSQVLSFASAPSNAQLWVANAPYASETRGVCDSTHPLCIQDQDLFIDSVLQTPATSSAGLKPGSWYFDTAHNNVYLPSNPTGHLLELGMQTYAFFGQATGVQIADITVEKYTTPAEEGAIGGDGSGTGWLVNDVECRWNHGTGAMLGSSSELANSFIHNNGETGIKFSGSNGTAINNEISWNNYAGFYQEFEAGGSKFWETTNLQVESNYVHDNNGKGLWADTNNVGTLYEDNVVVNNAGVGIQHEISYAAIIRDNVVKGNTAAPTTWVGNAQIRINNSPNVQVYGNTVEASALGGDGIAIINESRGSGSLGPWIATNDYVHNNTIIYLGTDGVSGFEDDGGGDTSKTNLFDYNEYVFSGSMKRWRWEGGETWQTLHALGQEEHGTCCNLVQSSQDQSPVRRAFREP
jgi:hypothetical protein